MAQDGHHDTASDDEGSLAPPTTVTFTLSPGENNNGGSRTGSPMGMDASKGKEEEVVLDAIHGGERGPAGSGKENAAKSKGKRPASCEAAGDGFRKTLAAGDGNIKAHIVTERERRRRMKDMFSGLHALMPHVSEKVWLSQHSDRSCEAHMCLAS